MTAQTLSAGQWQRLRSLTDEAGRFKMMAVDQRFGGPDGIALDRPSPTWYLNYPERGGP